jgi:signal peptidase II
MSVVTKIACSLFAAGIVGNLLDRVLKGSVVDFLDFYIKSYSWPSFNVADSCICIAAALLVLMSFRKPQPGSLTGPSKSS